MLLTAIAERAEMRGRISVNVTDRDGMLSEIIVQLRQKASHILAPETNSWLSEIHVHGVGFTRTREEVPSTWRADMTKAVSELNEKGSGLPITVDEASAQSDELPVLIDSFHISFASAGTSHCFWLVCRTTSRRLSMWMRPRFCAGRSSIRWTRFLQPTLLTPLRRRWKVPEGESPPRAQGGCRCFGGLCLPHTASWLPCLAAASREGNHHLRRYGAGCGSRPKRHVPHGARADGEQLE